eukprot:scaffold237581_cov44-Tisochrysis_lutea.AAC.1
MFQIRFDGKIGKERCLTSCVHAGKLWTKKGILKARSDDGQCSSWQLGSPVLSIRLAVFIVSPKIENLGSLEPIKPDTTSPVCR